MEKKSTSPFMGRTDSFKKSKKVYDPVLTDTYLKEVCVKTGEGPEEFFVDKILSVSSTKSRQKFLDAQAKDVGVLNVIKKTALSGENALDGRYAFKDNSFVDADMFPQTLEATINLAHEKERIWSNLDPALKNNMSFEQFCQSINEEKLVDYLKTKVPQKSNKTEVKTQGGAD